MLGADQGFEQGLLSRVAEVQQHALGEVKRLEEALEQLRSENESLRSRLGDHSPRRTPSKASKCIIRATPVLENEGNNEIWSPPSHVVELERKRNGEAMDVLGLKRQLTSKMSAHNEMNMYKDHGFAQRIARCQWFESLTLSAVTLNALWIALDLDLNGKPLLESPIVFQAVEYCFVVIFSSEMLVRYCAFRHKIQCLYDRWFVFDSVLVLLMIIESVVITFILWITSGHSSSNFLGILSVLRTLRLLRLGRIARLFKVVPELRTIISGMLAGVRSVAAAGCILVSMTFMFAIMLRQVSMGTTWGNEYFRTVPHAVLTLLVESMFPDNGVVLFEIGKKKWYAGAAYFVFLLLTAITIMNMLIGILCDVVGRVSSYEKEVRSLDLLGEKLQAILRSVDRNYDGLVSRAEFEGILQNKEAIKILVDVGVDVLSLVEEAEYIFSNDSKKQLPFDEFKEVVLQFRATNTAAIRTISALRRDVRYHRDSILARLMALEGGMNNLRPTVALRNSL